MTPDPKCSQCGKAANPAYWHTDEPGRRLCLACHVAERKDDPRWAWWFEGRVEP